MNYYQHHIGDFNNATRHLTRVERSLYRDAIELYYDKEKPLDSDFDRLSKRLMARTEEEKKALEDVLSEFFTLKNDGYHHPRCDEEIRKYQANSTAKSRAGKASAAKRQQKKTGVKQKTTRVQQNESGEQLTNNQEPETNNHKPINNKQNKDLFVLPDNIDSDTWKAFQEHRRKLKAPMTDRAKTLMINKLLKLPGNPNDILNQSIENGWKGVFELKGQNNGQNQTTHRTSGEQVDDELNRIAQDAIDRGETL